MIGNTQAFDEEDRGGGEIPIVVLTWYFTVETLNACFLLR